MNKLVHQWACIIMSMYFPVSGVARTCGIILQQRAKTRPLITERREGLHVIQSWVQSNTHQRCEGWRNKIWKPERAYDLEEQRVWCCDHVEENLVTGIIDCWCLQEKKTLLHWAVLTELIYKKEWYHDYHNVIANLTFFLQFFVMYQYSRPLFKTYVVWTMFFSLSFLVFCLCCIFQFTLSV